MEQQVATAAIDLSEIMQWSWLALIGVIVWLAKRQIARMDQAEKRLEKLELGMGIIMYKDESTGMYVKPKK